jgi:hypothetical protein
MLLWDEIHGEPTQASTPVPTHDIDLQADWSPVR